MSKAKDYKKTLRARVEAATDPATTGALDFVALAHDTEQVDALIETLTSDTVSKGDKLSALTRLQIIDMFSRALPTKSAKLIGAMRGLIQASDTEIRVQALKQLTLIEDEVAQEMLHEQLLSAAPEANKLVPTHMAIALLGLHEKSLDTTLLLEIAKSPPDEKSRFEAVRHLPVDDDTLPTLVGILTNNNMPARTRALVPQMISEFEPTQFLIVAEELLGDDGLDTEIASILAPNLMGLPRAAYGQRFEHMLHLVDEIDDEAMDALVARAQIFTETSEF